MVGLFVFYRPTIYILTLKKWYLIICYNIYFLYFPNLTGHRGVNRRQPSNNKRQRTTKTSKIDWRRRLLYWQTDLQKISKHLKLYSIATFKIYKIRIRILTLWYRHFRILLLWLSRLIGIKEYYYFILLLYYSLHFPGRYYY